MYKILVDMNTLYHISILEYLYLGTVSGTNTLYLGTPSLRQLRILILVASNNVDKCIRILVVCIRVINEDLRCSRFTCIIRNCK